MTLNKEALEKATYAFCHQRNENTVCEQMDARCSYCEEQATKIITAYLTSLPSAHGELVEAINAALDWFDKANAPADEGCDFLNEGGWDEAPQIAATLRAAAAALREKEGWLPIGDDAKKNGVPVLVAAPGWKFASEASWHEDHDGWWLAGTNPTDAHDGQCYPTVWRPLPIAPQNGEPQ